jgi:UDP-N-acetylglucosamine:LPS N-acetylglucosamine transferase
LSSSCSFLPGQEVGNVEVVLKAGFGDFCHDPAEIAREVACWLQDEGLLATMSNLTSEVGHPTAAAEIVQDIGNIAHAWIDINLAANNGDRRSILESSL